MKLSLLALISTVVAVPHYGHSKFHHKPSGGYGTGVPGTGHPIYPTGALNSTRPYPTASGVDDKTTTLEETTTSTTTLVSTIIVSGSPAVPTSAEVADVTTGGAPGCGPATITVTAQEKVTVTVPYGGESSSVAVPASSSVVVPSGGYEAPSSSKTYVAPPPPSSSSSAAVVTSKEEQPTKPVETPTPAPSTTAVYTSAAPSSSAVVPSSSSSAQPTPSGTPSYSGGKRGLAYNDVSLCSAFAGNAAWAYNWASSPGGTLPEGVKYVPMSWVKNEDAKTWLGLVDQAVKNGSDIVMGFNEPDHAEQAKMTASEACTAWESYYNPIATSHPDVLILGPSVTNAGNDVNMGLQWLQQFQDVCPQAVWHAANIHFYDIYQEGEGEAGTVGRFIAQVKKAAKQTGKKVWVTEFGLNTGSATPEQAAKFLTAVMEFMEGSDLVSGYSYFMVGSGENQLLSGNSLSAVGSAYSS